MKKWLKRIRGGFSMGLICAIGFGIVPPLGELVFDGNRSLDWSLTAAILGFIGGGVFSVALAVAGRRRRFDEMSLPLFAALGSLVPPVMFVILAWWRLGARTEHFFDPGFFVVTTVIALMGAGFGAGVLAIARMAEDQELLEAGEDVDDIGLTEAEKRELLST